MSKRNKSLAKQFRGKPCIVCQRPAEVDHLINYAGDPARDIPENIWPLCRGHHIEKGAVGLFRFVKKYSLELELIERGFYYDDFSKKYRYTFRKNGSNDSEKN